MLPIPLHCLLDNVLDLVTNLAILATDIAYDVVLNMFPPPFEEDSDIDDVMLEIATRAGIWIKDAAYNAIYPPPPDSVCEALVQFVEDTAPVTANIAAAEVADESPWQHFSDFFNAPEVTPSVQRCLVPPDAPAGSGSVHDIESYSVLQWTLVSIVALVWILFICWLARALPRAVSPTQLNAIAVQELPAEIVAQEHAAEIVAQELATSILQPTPVAHLERNGPFDAQGEGPALRPAVQLRPRSPASPIAASAALVAHLERIGPVDEPDDGPRPQMAPEARPRTPASPIPDAAPSRPISTAQLELNEPVNAEDRGPLPPPQAPQEACPRTPASPSPDSASSQPTPVATLEPAHPVDARDEAPPPQDVPHPSSSCSWSSPRSATLVAPEPFGTTTPPFASPEIVCASTPRRKSRDTAFLQVKDTTFRQVEPSSALPQNSRQEMPRTVQIARRLLQLGVGDVASDAEMRVLEKWAQVGARAEEADGRAPSGGVRYGKENDVPQDADAAVIYEHGPKTEKTKMWRGTRWGA